MRPAGKFVLTLVTSAIMLLAGFAPVEADNLFSIFGRDYIDGSGDLITEERDLDEFTSIENSGPFDLFVTVGEDQSLAITIDDNLMDVVQTRVRRGTLEIYSKHNFKSHRRSRIDITVPKLEELTVDGSGDIEVTNVQSEEFDIEISGSGDVDLTEMNAGEMYISIDGSGDVRADGQAQQLEIGINGSGDVDARRLEAEDVTVKVHGSGDVKVFASESFYGRVYGSGDITYWGNPENESSRVSGSGDIRRKR